MLFIPGIQECMLLEALLSRSDISCFLVQPKLPITSVAIVLAVGGVILETVSHAPVLGLFLPRVLQVLLAHLAPPAWPKCVLGRIEAHASPLMEHPCSAHLAADYLICVSCRLPCSENRRPLSMFGNVHVGRAGVHCAGLHALKHRAVLGGSGVEQDLDAAEFFCVAWNDVTVLRCRWLGGWRLPAQS